MTKKNNSSKSSDEVVQIKGELFDWFETGTEGIVWALQDEAHINEQGYYDYNGLYPLKQGDHLQVFDGDIEIWEGIIDPDYSVTQIGPCYTHWAQKGMDPVKWAHMFMELQDRRYHLTGIVTRLKGKHK